MSLKADTISNYASITGVEQNCPGTLGNWATLWVKMILKKIDFCVEKIIANVIVIQFP